MAAVIVHNNIPFAAADTFSPLFKEMFPASEIAKSYASARTKTTCIVNGALMYVCISDAKYKCNFPFVVNTLISVQCKQLAVECLV